MSTISTRDAAATQQVARELAGTINNEMLPLTIWLIGEIGSGKTTFAQGLINAMGWSERVKSPTYSLVESYDTPQGRIFHFDFYRINDVAELENIGIRDYFNQPALLLIEWANQMREVLPLPDLSLHFAYQDNLANNMSGRNITFVGESAGGKKLINQINQ